MPKCIYREVVLNLNKPEDDDTVSKEHIIPWSVGGSNGLVTFDVSKLANNTLGSEVDAAFANTLPIAIKRHQLQLKSQNGNIPPIVWRGETPDGTPGKMIIHSDGNVDVDLDLKVDKIPSGLANHMTVSGTRAGVEPILKGMLAGMKKRGEQAYSLDGSLLTSLEDCLNASEQKLVDKLKFEVEYFNEEAWARGILKIVLGLGHTLLGAQWTFGPSASLLREFVNKPRSQWPSTPPRGYIAGEWDRNLRVALGKTGQVRDELQHTLAILPTQGNGEAAAFISLFGGNGVPEAVVRIGMLPQHMIDALNSGSNTKVTLGFRVDPRTRVTTPIHFGEIDRRIAKMGPSNRKALELRWTKHSS